MILIHLNESDPWRWNLARDGFYKFIQPYKRSHRLSPMPNGLVNTFVDLKLKEMLFLQK